MENNNLINEKDELVLPDFELDSVQNEDKSEFPEVHDLIDNQVNTEVKETDEVLNSQEVHKKLLDTIVDDINNSENKLTVKDLLFKYGLHEFLLTDALGNIYAEDELLDSEGNNLSDELVDEVFIPENGKLALVLKPEKHTSNKNILKILIPILLGLLLLGAAMFGLYKFLDKSNNSPTDANTFNIMDVQDIDLDAAYVNGIEYGSGTIKLDTILDKDKYINYSIKAEPSELDTSKVGSTKVKFTLTNINNDKESNEFLKTIEVIDSNPTNIVLNINGVNLEVGEEFNLDSYVEDLEVIDSIDGEFELVEEEPKLRADGTYEKGWYTITDNVDTSKEGNYKIVIRTVDKHGQELNKEIPVKIKSLQVDPTSEPTTAPRNTATPTPTPVANNKCKYTIIDRAEVKEVTQRVWVVDVPAQSYQEGQRWVETSPAQYTEVYVVDVKADPEQGIEEQGHLETVVIQPAQGYWETYVIQEEIKEQGHWETKIIVPYQSEQSHVEERDC